MHLVLLIGPPAVGKMSVGRVLAQRSGYRLFHNHAAIEPVLGVFDRSTPSFSRLSNEIRRLVIAEAVSVDLAGLILTYVWDFDDPGDQEYVEWLIAPAVIRGCRVDYVELYADQATRLRREGTPERLAAKPSLSDQDAARTFLVSADEHNQLSSHPGQFPWPDQHLVLDTSELSVSAAAHEILLSLDIRPATPTTIPSANTD